MGYAIEVLFDNIVTEAIIEIWRQFKQNGYGIDLQELGSKPHVALSVYDEVQDENTISEITRIISEEISSFDVELEEYGTFDTNEGVVFVKIRKTDILEKYHETLHKLSTDIGLVSNQYYTPENWFPHCTLGINIKSEYVADALKKASTFELPESARVHSISAIKFRPVESMCEYELQEFQPQLKRFLGKQVCIKIDRRMNSKHPKYGFTYPCNYGYVPDTMNEDGKEVDVYLLGIREPVEEFDGKCIAILHRYNDYDDKLIVVPSRTSITSDEIRKMTNFQEQYFSSEIVREEGAREE